MMNSKSNELEKLNEQLKYTRRKYKKTIINSKIKLLKTKIASKNCITKIEAYKGNCINRVVNTKDMTIKLVENSIKNNVNMISSEGFVPDESLVKLYSLIDKTTYILKSKPSKIPSFRQYISKVFSAISNSLSTLRIYFARKLAFPPILYSKSFTMSIIEVKSWHSNLYLRLTTGFKDFRKTLLNYKSKLDKYDSILLSSKARCNNAIQVSISKGRNAARESISKGKTITRRFL
ncbi:MAG: hypothetical protein QXM35_07550 [Candidatus Methanomethylicia archaeon]